DEGSGTPTEPHHTPFPEAETSHPTTSSILIPSIPTAPIPPVTQSDTTPIRQYTRRARIAQSSALPTVADEHASLVKDVSEGEACPTDSGFIADQDRATIAKSSTLPHDSVPRVTSPTADEGSMQHNISELTALCTSLQRVKVLEDKEDVAATQSGDDAPIKGRSINEGEAAAERINLLKQLDREDLNLLWALVKEYLSIRPAQKLYDLSGGHHLTAKDREIFMLVEKDYPLRKGLALVMISYKLQVENYSQMAEDLIRKIFNIANTPRQQGN
nr:hypothetical protein [Tanacetum cinerariifolium]GEX31491.1 hypothetical protein [Tanacetum cinerariifolium]